MALLRWQWLVGLAILIMEATALQAFGDAHTARIRRSSSLGVASPVVKSGVTRVANSAPVNVSGNRAAGSVENNEVSATSFTPAEAVPLPFLEGVTPGRKLVYEGALKAQLAMIEELGMECVAIDEKFVKQTSSVKPARIGNLLFRNEQWREVRLTYFDGGNNVQVFNALWQPSYEYDAPMLGVDLISLGKQRVLSVVDMQPLHPTADYANDYILRPEITAIRAQYPDLHGKLSGKIYDDTSFFSDNMLFGRFTDESKLAPCVLPAHDAYLRAYIDTFQEVGERRRDASAAAMAIVRERQTEYDVYSALKDPAVGLFDAYFGKEWSHSFVHEFLFALATQEEGVSPVHSFNVDGSSNGSSGAMSPHQ